MHLTIIKIAATKKMMTEARARKARHRLSALPAISACIKNFTFDQILLVGALTGV